jgi:hypothetical protein
VRVTLLLPLRFRHTIALQRRPESGALLNAQTANPNT